MLILPRWPEMWLLSNWIVWLVGPGFLSLPDLAKRIMPSIPMRPSLSRRAAKQWPRPIKYYFLPIQRENCWRYYKPKLIWPKAKGGVSSPKWINLWKIFDLKNFIANFLDSKLITSFGHKFGHIWSAKQLTYNQLDFDDGNFFKMVFPNVKCDGQR